MARTPTRLLIMLARTQEKARDLYNCSLRFSGEIGFYQAERLKWTGQGFQKDVSLRYASLIVKDAPRFFRNDYGIRPNVNTKNPDIRIWVNFENILLQFR